MVFVFGSVYVMDYIYRFAYVEPALHPWDEAYLIVMYKPFDVLLYLVCQYFIEGFCINLYHGYGPEVFFFVESGLFFVGRLLVASLTSDLVIGFSGIQLLPGLVLGGCMCPGIYPFLVDFLVYLWKSVYIIL